MLINGLSAARPYKQNILCILQPIWTDPTHCIINCDRVWMHLQKLKTLENHTVQIKSISIQDGHSDVLQFGGHLIYTYHFRPSLPHIHKACLHEQILGGMMGCNSTEMRLALYFVFQPANFLLFSYWLSFFFLSWVFPMNTCFSV